MVWIWILLFLVSVYFLGIMFLYIRQDRYIFEPVKLPADHEFSFETEFEELFIETWDGKLLNALWFKVESPKGCVLYHHGNAYNLEFWGKFHKIFTDNGYDVLMYDYRGYGKSTGRIFPGCLKQDALKVYLFLLRKYGRKNIIQFGRSLGTGIAASLASRVKAPLLILETPYYSIMEMANQKFKIVPLRWVLRFPMRTDFYISALQCPIFVFHGTKDVKIPYLHSEKLARLNSNVQLITIENGTHMNLDDFEEYRQELTSILKNFR